jgi:hypothetical protein
MLLTMKMRTVFFLIQHHHLFVNIVYVICEYCVTFEIVMYCSHTKRMYQFSQFLLQDKNHRIQEFLELKWEYILLYECGCQIGNHNLLMYHCALLCSICRPNLHCLLRNVTAQFLGFVNALKFFFFWKAGRISNFGVKSLMPVWGYCNFFKSVKRHCMGFEIQHSVTEQEVYLPILKYCDNLGYLY